MSTGTNESSEHNQGDDGGHANEEGRKSSTIDENDLMLPIDREPVLRVIPMPRDINVAGDVFGGWIMAQVDLAGSVPAAEHAQGRIVTVAVNSFLFKQPVAMGDLCSFYARVDKVGRTSMRVFVEVYAQRRLKPKEVVKVTEAYITYVAVDEHRKPRPVPPLE